MKVIIFDLEEVVIDTWHKISNIVPEMNALSKEILEKTFSGPIQKEFYIGKITEEEFWQKTLNFLNLKIDVEKLKQDVRHLMVELPEIKDLVLRLKQYYKVVLLSNFPKEWFDYVNTKYNLNNLFDMCLISGYTGIRKPDADAYLQITKPFTAEPNECLVIDDKERNISGAEKIGMKGIIFTDIIQLKRDLEKTLKHTLFN